MYWKNIKKDAVICTQQILVLLKWIALSMVIGIVIGVIASGFSHMVTWATAYRMGHPLIVLGLPIGGLLIAFLYRISGEENNSGTNLVLDAVRTEENIPLRVAPLILASTIITHLFGGSSGREGAALQFGGSIGSTIARLFRLNESTTRIVIMASMSAAFSALFGTPLAAAIFSMEVISVGIMYYAALVPCLFSAFCAHAVAVYFQVHSTQAPYPVDTAPVFYSINGLKIVVVGICCAAVGVIFCIALHTCGDLYKKYFKNSYVRIFVGGLLVVGLTWIVGTQDYLGLGGNVIHASFEGAARPEAFIFKIIFTCLTLCAGYKGGEIVPSLFIGATLGCFLSGIIGLPADICAASGMVGVFCAVTNSPISSILIAFELFGFTAMPYFSSTIAVSYMLSGYFSLYHSQKIVYSKTETKYLG